MWYYEGKEFTSEMINDYVGFVYLITDPDGMKYIGKKLFRSTKRLPPLKGKKRKRVKVTESDWKSYHGSNEALKKLVEEKGSAAFDRQILRLCETKGECSYWEAYEQFTKHVLYDKMYHNGYIGCRINSKHLKHLKQDKL